MMKLLPLLALAVTFALVPMDLAAQTVAENLRDQLLSQFNYSAMRIVSLTEEMPEEHYNWRPGEGVMSVEEVYAHIAHYNYYYPATSLGISAPEDVQVEEIEGIQGKRAVVAILRGSVEHARSVLEGMSDADLSAEVTLYGRSGPAWTVLLQLVTHMNEHVGQSIAYARTNGVVPPWSRRE